MKKNPQQTELTKQKLQDAFWDIHQDKTIEKITVREISERAGVNRSTFYANFLDVYDLADKVRETLETEFGKLFADYDYFNERTGALKMFTHIKENQIFYKTYFKLCYDDKHLVSIYDTRLAEQEHIDSNIKYHIEFFRNGLNAIIKLWLAGGCRETPEEMAEVLKAEYRGR